MNIKFGDKVTFKQPKGYMSASRRGVLGKEGIVIARAFNDVLSVAFKVEQEQGFLYQVEFCLPNEVDLLT